MTTNERIAFSAERIADALEVMVAVIRESGEPREVMRQVIERVDLLDRIIGVEPPFPKKREEGGGG